MADGPNLPPVGAEEEADAAKATIKALEDQLRRIPKSRAVERGVYRYRLGLAYQELPTGSKEINLSRAVSSLEEAARLFDPTARPIEHARTQNALGAALRELGQKEEAAEAFRKAADLVPLEISPGEHGAARNNLGLVLADLGQTEAAVEAYTQALEAFQGNELVRQRIAVLHNLGQILSGSDDQARVREGLQRYSEALELADPQEHAYQWGLIHHSMGVAYTGINEPQKAIEAFEAALRVFTRPRFPFQYALTKSNLGLAYAQMGGQQALRRSVVASEDALRMLDVRMHREQWQQAYRNLELVEKALEDSGEQGTRAEHFARLAAEEEDEALLGLFRERLSEYTFLPEPRRTEVLAELDHAILSLPDAGAQKVTTAWLNVLMELPHEQFAAGLQARMAVHNTFDEAGRRRAAEILDHTIQNELLAPQRIRVRDTLAEMGYARPEA